MKKIINPWRNHEGYNCFGCSPDNPIGLHLEFYEDGDYIVSTWHPGHNYQGWVDTMTASYVLRMTREESAMLITSWRAPSEVINRTLLALADQFLSQLARLL